MLVSVFLYITHIVLRIKTIENAKPKRSGVFCSLKNEGYNYKPLCRLALRRVEQLYSTVAVPSFEYAYIKHH